MHMRAEIWWPASKTLQAARYSQQSKSNLYGRPLSSPNLKPSLVTNNKAISLSLSQLPNVGFSDHHRLFFLLRLLLLRQLHHVPFFQFKPLQLHKDFQLCHTPEPHLPFHRRRSPRLLRPSWVSYQLYKRLAAADHHVTQLQSSDTRPSCSNSELSPHGPLERDLHAWIRQLKCCFRCLHVQWGW